MKRSLAVILLAVIVLLTAACGKANNANNASGVSAPDDTGSRIKVNLKLGEAAQYKTTCKNNASKTTVGTLTVKEVRHYKNGDELPDAKLQAKDGYEWIEVKVETVFDDSNAAQYGVDRASCVSDYYSLKLFETSLKTQGEFTSFAVRSKGSEVVSDECLFIKVVENQNWNSDNKNVCNYIWYLRVPEKYDGSLIVFMNAGTKWPEGKSIYEILDKDALVYRVTD